MADIGAPLCRSVKGENVVCEAQNDAMLDGLLTVIHSSDSEQVGGQTDRVDMLPFTSGGDASSALAQCCTSQHENQLSACKTSWCCPAHQPGCMDWEC